MLVAAVVFVSVAWSDLSLGAKAAIMLGVTAAIAAVGVWSLRKELVRSSEAFSVLSVVLVGLDFAAGHEGGLFGTSISGTGAQWITAILIALSGLGWAIAAQRAAAMRLVGAQVLAGLGVFALALLTLDERLARDEYVSLILAAIAAGLALAGRRYALRVLAITMFVVSGYLAVLGAAASLTAVLQQGTLRGLWSTGEAAGWLVCIALAAAAVWSRLGMRWRVGSATGAIVATALLVLRPLEGSSYDQILLALAGSTAVIAAASLLVPDPWRSGARLGALPVATLSALAVGPSLLQAIARAVVPLTDAWNWEPADHVRRARLDFFDDLGTPWLVGVVAVVTVLAVAIVLTRALPSVDLLFAVVAVSAALSAVCYPLYAGWVVVALLVGTAASGLGLLWRRSLALGAATVSLALLALCASAATELTTAGTALLYATVAGTAAVLVRNREASAISSTSALLFLGLSAAAATQFTEFGDEGLALVLVGIATPALIGAQTRLGGVAIRQREGLEVGGVLLGVIALGLARESDVHLPIAMTVLGAALVVIALLRDDRRPASAIGGALLAGASWVRLIAEDVDVIEAYTLPTALVLLGLGGWRMRQRPESSSLANLAPGLSLALVPSLLAALPEPTSLRALLLGIAALGVLLAGVATRWAAPLLVGGGVLAVLALVNLAPYAVAVPRWVLFALVGAALLYLGVTWERRLRDARNLTGVIEALR